MVYSEGGFHCAITFHSTVISTFAIISQTCNQPGRVSFQVDYSNNLYEIDDEKELVQEDNSHLEKNVLGDEKDGLWDEPENKEDELKEEKAKM